MKKISVQNFQMGKLSVSLLKSHIKSFDRSEDFVNWGLTIYKGQESENTIQSTLKKVYSDLFPEKKEKAEKVVK